MCEKLFYFIFFFCIAAEDVSPHPYSDSFSCCSFKWNANFSAVGLNAWKWTCRFVLQTVYHRGALCSSLPHHPSVSHPALFSTPPLYVTLSVPNQNDRQTLWRERQKEWKGRAEMLSLWCLCGWEHSQFVRTSSNVFPIASNPHPPPPLPSSSLMSGVISRSE